MKKVLYISLLLVLFLSLFGCTVIDMNNKISDNYLISKPEDTQYINEDVSLIINGTSISSNNLYINYEKQYAILPLITISKELGCEVIWHSEKKVTITYENDTFYLNPTKNTLFKGKKKDFNIITLPPGSNHGAYYKIDKDNKEFMIDNHSITLFLNMLGANIREDYENRIIKIDQTEDDSVYYWKNWTIFD